MSSLGSENINNKNILLFGTGKIGRNTCENLIKQTKNSKITLINRTKNKAEKIHPEIAVKNISELSQEINNTDILIVSTGANFPTITKEYIKEGKELLILDLSMPKNVDISLKKIGGITLINVDELSKITDKTIETRKKEIPITEKIIEQYKNEFENWLETRKYAPTIRALKSKLTDFKNLKLENLKKKKDGFNYNTQNWFGSSVLGVNLEIPVFNAFKLNVSSQKAKIAMNQAMTNLEEQEEKTQAKVQEKLNDYQLAIRILNVSEQNMRLSISIEEKNSIKFFEGIRYSIIK